MGCGGSKPDGEGPEANAGDGLGEGINENGRKMSNTKRRVAVRVDVEDDELDDDTPPNDFSEADKTRLKNTLKIADVTKELSEVEIDTLCNYAGVVEGIDVDEMIITQGEDGGYFYIVKSGVFEASLPQLGDKIVAEYRAIDDTEPSKHPEGSVTLANSFGELALLYNAPRAANVKCTEKGYLWYLERKKFRAVMMKAGEKRENDMANFLKTIQLFSPLTDDERSRLAQKCEPVTLQDGEYVIKVDDPADALYLVKQGELVATLKDKKEVARYHTGMYFGESCLKDAIHIEELKLGSKKWPLRTANIISVAGSQVFKIKAEDFVNSVGDLAEITVAKAKRDTLALTEVGDKSKGQTKKLMKLLKYHQQEDLITKLTEVTFEKDEKLITQGQVNQTFFVIASGKAAVMQEGAPGAMEKSETRQLATLAAGDIVGEKAIIDAKRSGNDTVAVASIQALDGKLTCYKLEKDDFIEILYDHISAEMDSLMDRRAAEAAKKVAPKWEDLDVRRILGVGTFGRVKLVVHKPAGSDSKTGAGQTPYALKCMRKAQVVATKQQSHVLNEKNILAMMEHPFILALVATYQDNHELYMLLELALGGELFTLLAKRAPLFDSPARFYTGSVVSMFSYMHQLRVVYRDLKPENLLLDDQGYLKLVDFGFAKILQERTWTLCGTPEYLAPEIILNKGHGFGADWWCVGILAYECLSGTTPFVSNDPMEGYRKIIKCKVQWSASFSANAKNFMDRLLVVDPSRRLGCLKGGSKDVMADKWFQPTGDEGGGKSSGAATSSIDFNLLKQYKYASPYVPKIKNPTDDSNFDTYVDEGIINYPQAVKGDQFKEFADDWVGMDA